MAVVLDFTCPRCSYACDAATAPEGHSRPKPGDISCCLKCGAPMEFAAGAAPRWLTFEEIDRLAPETKAYLSMIALAILTHRPAMVKAV